MIFSIRYIMLGMDVLPYDVKRYEILRHIDDVSRMVLRHVLLQKPLTYIPNAQLDLVVSYGTEFTKWFYRHGVINRGSYLSSVIAKYGNLELLKWALANGCDWDERTCSYAAYGGHLEVLKWAHANGCNWDTWTCSNAASNGHLDCLKWARANGCDWDVWTCSSAARNGHLNCLKWARANGCDWDANTCILATYNSRLDVLKWARENCAPE
jgi:hypothetical protein